MKLKRILLCNFRNYLNETLFDLSNKVTILYGDNGNGKSSFFDAIEWCITDDVSRFNSGQDEKKNILSNSNMELNDECSVAIYFDDYILKRSFKKIAPNKYSNTQIILINTLNNSEVKGKTKVEAEINRIVSKNNEDNWSSELLGQAYILSQSQINNFITKDTRKDRYKSLASIMGFEKINTIRSNLVKTLRELETKITQIEDSNSILKENIETKTNKLKNRMEKWRLCKEDITEKFDIKISSNKLTNIKTENSKVVNQLNKIKKVYSPDNNGYKAYEDSINNLKLNIKKIEDNSDELTTKKNYLFQQIAEIDKVISQIEQEREQVERQTRKFNRLNKLLNKIESNNYKYNSELLNQLLSNLKYNQTKLAKVEFAIENIENYKEITEKNKLSNKEIEYLEEELLANQEKVNSLSREKEILTTDFNEGEVLNNIQALLVLVENANDFSKGNTDFEHKCPVCDSKVKDISDFFDLKIQKLIRESGTYKELIQNNMNKREKIEIERRDLLKKREEVSDKVKKLKKYILNNLDYLTQVQNNNLFEEVFFEKEFIELKKVFNTLTIEKNTINENISIVKEIINLKNEVELSENILITSNNFSVKELTIKKDKYLKEINIITEKLLSYKQSMDNQKEDMNSLINARNIMDSIAKVYGIENYDKLINFLNKEHVKLNEEEKKIENSFQKSEKINELNRLHNKIDVMKKEVKEKDEVKSYLEDKLVKINEKIELLNNRFGKKTTEFLNNEDSSIIKYYRYLNPNPTEFDELYFEISNNDELDIKVKNQLSNLNANYVLSSGQLNVLAISVFIATNMAQTFSLFDFVAIDDPIQNMDDVNRFSITDVLSELNRQLIFSTHDFDYLNLFLKKNEHRLDDIAVYYLDSENNEYKNLLINF